MKEREDLWEKGGNVEVDVIEFIPEFSGVVKVTVQPERTHPERKLFSH